MIRLTLITITLFLWGVALVTVSTLPIVGLACMLIAVLLTAWLMPAKKPQ